MEHWYVYYKLPATDRAQTIACVQRMQHALASEAGSVRLVERAEDSTTRTFMEIYERIEAPARFADVLEDAVSRSGLPAELRAARRTERFRDLER
jgi:hypothetical protein